MGEVYAAQHTLIGRACAIKMLPRDESVSVELIQRMIREAQAASAIGHPNIVQVYDFRQAPDGRHFMVMELLSGYSLTDLLDRHGHLTVVQATAIMIQILSALVAAHQKGIVHRDLKPDNVYIAKSGAGGYVVKLLDFGISKFVADGPEKLRLTRSGMIMGTPYYMSPEQAEGKKEMDVRVDVWACGIMLYEMITGNVPFPGESYNEVLAAILMKPFVLPSKQVPGLDPHFESIIVRALEKKPRRRTESAQKLFRALLPFYEKDVVTIGDVELLPSALGTDPIISVEKLLARGIRDSKKAAPPPPDGAPPPVVATEAVDPAHKMKRDALDLPPPPPRDLVSDTLKQGGTVTHGESVVRHSLGKSSSARWPILLVAVTALAVSIGGVFFVRAVWEGEERGVQKKEKRVAGRKQAKIAAGADGASAVGRRSAQDHTGAADATAQNARGGPGRSGKSTPDAGASLRARDGRSKKKIRIQLARLPASARIRLDDKPVEPPLILEADGERHCLKITASRRRFFARCFTADRNHRFTVKLRRVRHSRRPSTRTRGSSRTAPSVYDNPYQR